MMNVHAPDGDDRVTAPRCDARVRVNVNLKDKTVNPNRFR